MDALRIRGGRTLSGKVEVSGSKNAALPIMCAALLAEGESTLERVPDLADVNTLNRLLASLGVGVQRQGGRLRLDASRIGERTAAYDLVRTMRASFLVLGPLLARFGQAKVSLPGGCAIGARPVDQHLKGLEKLGARFDIEHGYVLGRTDGLVGAEVVFDMPTVGGTENLMLAATLARGTTVLNNAAREPEIVDLGKALSAMGAHIEGAGSDRIVIEGQSQLRPAQHRVVADRIELGTYLVAGALCGENVRLIDGVPEHHAALIDVLRRVGATIEIEGTTLTVQRATAPRAVDIKTAPYPGFATDMQAQLMALLSVASGESVITETIFENRFMHVAELDRLGAKIRVEGGQAFVRGVPKLSGTTVMATDLRASACLVLAGLVADGETQVRRIYHLDRGYEHLDQKLRALGADIERFTE